LALQRGGEAIDDPRAWLDSLPDDVVRLWDAYWQLEPWGGDWARHADLMVLMDHIYALVANKGLGRESRHLAYKPRGRRSFMPMDYAGESPKRTSRKSTAQQCEEYMAAYMQRGD
jgi:hypothetical protein